MQTYTLRGLRGVSIGGVILVAIGVAGYAMLRIDTWADRGNQSPASFTLDLDEQWAVDPALLRYAQTEAWDVGIDQLYAITVGPEDRVYVAADGAVHVLQPDGRRGNTISVDGQPRCLAVGGADHVEPGRIYVGIGGRVELFDESGNSARTWNEGLGEGSLPTSIALSNEEVFVADAGRRVVLRLDQRGNLLGRIGQPDADRQMPGFIVPSPYFDVAMSPESSLYIVNPGMRRIEDYTLDGQLQTLWGSAGSSIGDFFGCCNPAHISLLPDGRLVTSEKGVPRVKVYSSDGELECVVAGPQQLAVTKKQLGDPRLTPAQCVYDVATDSQGRILVLDPMSQQVRVFQASEPQSGDGA